MSEICHATKAMKASMATMAETPTNNLNLTRHPFVVDALTGGGIL